MSYVPLKKLSAQHHQIARLRVEGFSSAEIAEAVKMTREHVMRLWNDPLIIAEVDRLHEAADNALVQRLSAAGARALEVMVEIAQKPSLAPNAEDAVKMRAAEAILDRIPSMATMNARSRMIEAANSGGENGNGGGDSNFTAIFNSLTDDQIRQLARSWGQQALEAGDVIEHNGKPA